MLDPTNVYGVYLLFISSQRKTSKCLKKIQKNFQLTEKTKSKIAKMKFIFLLIYYIRGTVNGQGSSYRKLFESLIVSPSHTCSITINSTVDYLHVRLDSSRSNSNCAKNTPICDIQKLRYEF